MEKYSVRISVGALNEQQFSVAAVKAASDLNWYIKEARSSAIVFLSPKKTERITVTLIDNEAEINSESLSIGFKNRERNNKNEEDLVEKLQAVLHAYTPEELTEIHEQELAEQEKHTLDLQQRMMNDELTAVEKMQLGVGGYTVTYFLIAANILIFILMAFSGVSIMDPTSENILSWGGNFRMYTMNGEWWRLITCVFVHIGIIHLLMNMYALYIIGKQLEPLMGKLLFSIIYLSTGIFASLTSLWWSNKTVSAGASGAIFGMYGVFLALLTTNYIDKETRKQLLSSIGIFVGYNLLYGMKAGIDNAAHIGGLVSGLVWGYIFYYTTVQNKMSHALTSGIAVGTTLICAVLMLSGLNTDEDKFESAILKFSDYENTALEPLQNYKNLRSGELENKLRNKSLPAWKNCKIVLAQTTNYKLSDVYTQRRNLLSEYVDLRIRQTELYIQSESEKTNKYDSAIIATNNEVVAVINKLDTKKEQP